MPPAPDPWLIYRRALPGARFRLFCFPYGGGGASVYTRWQSAMPQGLEIFPVQTPGRENRFAEEPIADMTQMVDLLLEVVTPYLDLPFALFGHSVGALEAFELARRLRRHGLRSPEWLFVSGHPSPGSPPRLPPVHRLPMAAFMEAMREHYAMDPAILAQPEVMELIYPTLRADYELVETYVLGGEPPLEMPISAFGGRLDPETTEGEIEAWKRHTTGSFKHRMFDGNHMFINSSRDDLLDDLGRELAQVLERR